MPRAAIDTTKEQIGRNTTLHMPSILATDKEVIGDPVREEVDQDPVDGPVIVKSGDTVGRILSKDETEYLAGLSESQRTKFLQELAFNEELVDITIHESSNPNDENPVQVAVGGRRAFVWRGQRTTIRRYFVERLAQAKVATVKQKRGVDDEGNEMYTYPKTHALKYPFKVDSDTNPNGAAWLRKILSAS